MVKIIGLGEYAVSDQSEDSIKTFALGSCVGIVLYNRKEKKLGMVHIVLPEKFEYREHAYQNKIGYFADIGVPMIFEKVFGGYPIQKKDYYVSLYGGAISRKGEDYFCIGMRNLEKIEEILRKHGVQYDKRYTGGQCSRTIEAFVSDGRIEVKEQKVLFFC